jgi:hypothetical protein
VEGIRAAHRLRGSVGDHDADPLGCVGRHVRQLPGTPGAEGVEEGVHGLLVPAGRGPDQASGVVVDHDGEVLVAPLVADLIDADPAQTGQPVGARGEGSFDPGDDRSHGAPGDP